MKQNRRQQAVEGVRQDLQAVLESERKDGGNSAGSEENI